MDWYPNIDHVLYFTETGFPTIRAAFDGASAPSAKEFRQTPE